MSAQTFNARLLLGAAWTLMTSLKETGRAPNKFLNWEHAAS